MGFRQFILLWGGCSFFLTSVAQSIAPNSYAIVVGISKYRFIKPLTYADKDAELFAELLMSGAGGSLKADNIYLLKNDSANAGSFWSALQRLSNKKLTKGDRVYIFFAGHGDAVKGLNEYYLLLSDCQAGNDGNNYHLSMAAIDMYHLKNRIGLLTRQGVEVILVLDACRTNELAGGYASQSFSNSIIQSRVGEISMLATGPGQVSIEDASFGNGHGLFTYNLVDAWSGRADSEETGNKDKSISLREIQDWVIKSVSNMSEKFRVQQKPVFCCDEKQTTTIGYVDSSFSYAWNQWKGLQQNSSPTNIKNPRNNSRTADSTLLVLLNQFNDARKDNRLWGENSADSLYEQMRLRFPQDSITDEARYILASDFINFAQQKINLYLEGKDLLSVERLVERADSAGAPNFLSDEYERMQRAVSEKWTIAGMMIEKASKMLSSKNDSTLFYRLKPRIAFLFARGYINGEKESPIKFKDALQYSIEAFRADSNAAYTAECLALLYSYQYNMGRMIGLDNEYEMGMQYNRTDTAMNYFKKAIQLAPKWANPYRGIALKVYGELQSHKAIPYLHEAIALNPEDAMSYIMIGDLYRQQRPDSALFYFRKALLLSGKSSHDRIYRKMARVFLLPGHLRNAPTFKPDSVLYYSRLALELEPTKANDPAIRNAVLRDVYLDIAHAYERQQKNKEALQYFFKVRALYPDHAWANRAVIEYYTKTNKSDSIIFYSHLFLRYAPTSGYAMLALAKLYDEQLKLPDSAIYYYQRSLDLPGEKDLPYERLGYLLMAKDKMDPRPEQYFMKAVKKYPNSWRPYYNTACYYANKGDNAKALELLEKALSMGLKNRKLVVEESYFKSLVTMPEFKALIAKYFP